MRHGRRRNRRGRVVVIFSLVCVFAAAGGWWMFGRGTVRQAQATPVDANAAATPAGAQKLAGPAGGQKLAGPVEAPPRVISELAAAPANPGVPSPGVPSLDQLAGADEPLRPRTGATAGATPAPDAAGAPAATEPPRPGALKPVEPAPPIEEKKPAAEEPASGNTRIDAAVKLYGDGKVIEARHELNALLKQGLSRADEAEVRRQLVRMADDSIFSRRQVPGDPLADAYTVQSGDRLVNVCRDYKVPPEILMYINSIKDATKIRAEQKIKVLRGPFHVKIYKSQFRMDVYLQDLYVHSYRVGLGADQGTPEGVWKVKERLHNPTYYPPASAQNKRIIPPDDPENPLGKHWIGLEGVSGDALGHTGYGMHGTIEPESVGRAVSLGCVRMLNEDVEFLYKLMSPGESTVTVLP